MLIIITLLLAGNPPGVGIYRSVIPTDAFHKEWSPQPKLSPLVASTLLVAVIANTSLVIKYTIRTVSTYTITCLCIVLSLQQRVYIIL